MPHITDVGTGLWVGRWQPGSFGSDPEDSFLSSNVRPQMAGEAGNGAASSVLSGPSPKEAKVSPSTPWPPPLNFSRPWTFLYFNLS